MIDYYETKSQPVTKVMVWQAYKEVKARGGSGGIDKMGWDYLAQNASTQIYQLWNRLTSGSYFPQPVKQVAIPKKDKGTRLLGIPTLLDRIAQQVVRNHLERVLEPLFHNSSFGYRPQRSCHQAVKQAYANTLNHDFAIDLDIKGFFDNIDHQLLLQALQHYCKDNWVLMYVTRWLKAGVVQQDGNFTPTLSGTPQGGVISPLLANLFLHVAFDKWMEKNHPQKPFERYADDIVVHCKTERQAQFMLREIKQRLSSCNLYLHEGKTKIVNLRGKAEKPYPKGFDFLGFTIRPGAYNHKGTVKAMPGIFVSQKSKNGIFQKFRKMVLHKRRRPLEELAKMVNPVARGIINYYHKFRQHDMSMVWKQLNARLLKWVKWEKDLYKKAAIKYLQTKYKEAPRLFVHWLLVHP
jgi:group II intron reverse transcriptase/maturase